MKQTDPQKRGAHFKGHGCARAEFSVLDDLPDVLRHGVFSNPKTYPAIIRFSNGFTEDDREADFHGVSIKLFGVPGAKLLDDERDAQTQDFVLTDIPAFFAGTVARLLTFMSEKAKLDAQGMSPADAMQQLSESCPHEVALFMKYIRHADASPLITQYWNCSPYRLGPEAVKYHIRPAASNIDGKSAMDSVDFLHDALVEHLTSQQKSARFDFFVQRQLDPETMPIEDASVEWDSPFEKVATITIPSQTFDSERQMTFCENLSFTPWHLLPEHRPLGGLNRARKTVYQASSKLRHKLKNVPRQEPLSVEEL